MSQKCDDLRLSLSLSLSLRCPQNVNPPPPPPPLAPPPPPQPPFPLSLLQSPLPFMQRQNQKSSTADPFQLSADRHVEGRSFLRGIDMNKPITLIHMETSHQLILRGREDPDTDIFLKVATEGSVKGALRSA
ncbi:small conductance calcium-activated potassium channel protein 3-like [Olea europaea var. sylvestris]|uniref:small conductance calcium-activated potassium channel protein 3-like n=1 Tax=Olea europaea var. sylvestris TaxID=158386 RepID=UPI000C1D3A7B|nr:small conductance calcium-activated potassium channel protein 3-like [Olea europaea var. sylvestris]